jgi:hypothetical protein
MLQVEKEALYHGNIVTCGNRLLKDTGGQFGKLYVRIAQVTGEAGKVPAGSGAINGCEIALFYLS